MLRNFNSVSYWLILKLFSTVRPRITASFEQSSPKNNLSGFCRWLWKTVPGLCLTVADTVAFTVWLPWLGYSKGKNSMMDIIPQMMLESLITKGAEFMLHRTFQKHFCWRGSHWRPLLCGVGGGGGRRGWHSQPTNSPSYWTFSLG